MEPDDVERIFKMAETLSDSAHHRLMAMGVDAHPCEAATCTLSQEEHHRLAYGILAENRDLRRRLSARSLDIISLARTAREQRGCADSCGCTDCDLYLELRRA